MLLENIRKRKDISSVVSEICESSNEDFAGGFHRTVKRKQAQIFQHRAEFPKALKILSEIVNKGELEELHNAQADIGLIEGKFKSMRFILPKRILPMPSLFL